MANWVTALLSGTFPLPGAVAGITNAIAVTTSFHNWLRTAGHWRRALLGCLNQNGQLGNGSTIARTGTPVAVNGVAMAVDTGGNHSCVIGPSGTVTCWGYNFYGQLGQGTGPASQPVVVSGINDATNIALGFDHTCAVLADGTGKCWGRNNLGQLGINSTQPAQTATPTSLTLLGSAVAIAAGAYHNCAVLRNGGVQCWGQNNVGQLAYDFGTGVIVTFPSTVAGITTAIAVTAGFEHSCALLNTGDIRCWGRNDEGQLGNGGTSNTNTPVAVVGISNATAIAAGNFHTCARLATSQIKCWGRGDEGQLGNGLFADSLTPVDAINDNAALTVTAGGYHNCLLAAGFVRCWGRGDLGQIGNGAFQNRPDAQSILNSALAVDAGRSHTCAVRADGSLQCWGYNEFGQLGNGGNSNSALPVPAMGLSMEAVALAWNPGSAIVTTAMSGHAQIADNSASYVSATYGPMTRIASLSSAVDTDGDGIADPADNCTLVANANQRDTNGDGYGNICDADFNGNGIVDSQDGALLKSRFGSGTFPDQDLNGNGLVDSQDGAILKARFGQPPGPSGLHPL
ncbi:MAG: hypothetical protein R3F24_06580 [Gammaproteobacteria bacterium]